MKKLLIGLLACLFIISLLALSSSAELLDDTFIPEDVAYSDSMNDNIGIASENYLPFVNVENYPFSDLIECSQCLPGYLYVANLDAHNRRCYHV